MKTFFVFVYCILGIVYLVRSQSSCYQSLKNKGLRLHRDSLYEKAINAYLAALNCDEIDQNELSKLIQWAQASRQAELIYERQAAEIARDSERSARQKEQQAREFAEKQNNKNKALSYASIAEQEADRDPVKGLRLTQLGYQLTDTALPRVKLAMSNIVTAQFTERNQNGQRVKYGQPIPVREFNIKPGNYNIFIDQDYVFLFDQIRGYSIYNKDSIVELIDLIYAPIVPLNLSNSLDNFSAEIQTLPSICGLKKHSIIQLEKPTFPLWGRICFSKSGNLFGAYTRDGVFNIWDTTGAIVFKRQIGNSINHEKIQFIRNDSSILIHGDTVLSGRWVYRAAKIWNLYSNEILDLGFVKDATQIEFSKDGMNFIITEREGGLALYNNSGKRIKYLKIPQNINGNAVFSSDGSRVYAFCNEGNNFIFDKNGRLIKTFKSPSEINYSPDFVSQKLIITSSGISTHLFNWEGDLIKTLNDPEGEGIQLSRFSPDGKKILSICEFGSIIIWDSVGNILHRIKSYITKNKGFGATATTLTDAAFTADSRDILIAFSDGKIQWFDLDGILVKEIISPDNSTASVAYFNNDDRKIIINNHYVFDRYNSSGYEINGCSNKGFVTPDRMHLISYDEPRNCICKIDNTKFWSNSDLTPPYFFSGDGSKIVTHTFFQNYSNRYIMLWDIDNEFIDSIRLNPINKEFGGENAIFINNDSVIIFNAYSNIPFSFNRYNKQKVEFLEKDEHVCVIDASEKSREVLTFSLDSILRIWSFSGQLIDTFKIPVNGYEYMAKFSEQGNYILFWSQMRMFFLNRKTRTRKEAERLYRNYGDYNNIVFSKKNRLFLTTEYSGSTVSVWDYTGKKRFFFRAHSPGMVFWAVFSPDEKHILTYSHDGTAKLWDVSYSGKGNNLIGVYKHAAEVNSGDFSSDGKYIMTAGNDRIVRIIPVPETIYEWIKNGTYPLISTEELINLGLEGQ